MPVRHGSTRVPDISVEDWNNMRGKVKVQQQKLHAERCEIRRQKKVKQLRTMMQQRLDKPSAHYVSYHAGTAIRLPEVSEEECSDNLILVSSTLGGSSTVDQVVDLSSPAVWQPLPGEENKGCKLTNNDDYSMPKSRDYAVVPSMPISSIPLSQDHRDFDPILSFPFDLLIAEPMTRAQRRQLPKAQAACDLEWNKLLARGTWDPKSVTEWKTIANNFMDSRRKVHVTKMFEICVVKIMIAVVLKHCAVPRPHFVCSTCLSFCGYHNMVTHPRGRWRPVWLENVYTRLRLPTMHLP